MRKLSAQTVRPTGPSEKTHSLDAAPLFSDSVMARVLAANVAEVVTVPTGARYASFSATDDIWVKLGATVAVPSVDITDGSSGVLNPGARCLPVDTTQIAIISPVAASVSIEFWE